MIELTCPICHEAASRRSRRRSLLDYVLSAGGVVPWRCSNCETRYYAREVPLRQIFYARCPTCGNLELQRISGDRMSGVASVVGKTLRVPSLRCVPCRHNFFTMRPVLRAKRG